MHEKLVNNDISTVDLTQATLENIEKTDSELQAFIRTNSDEALLQAKKLMRNMIFLIYYLACHWHLKIIWQQMVLKQRVRHIF